jgi:dTDP-4-dehydrorhamnose reductase
LGEVIAPERQELDLASAAQIEHSLDCLSPELIVNCAAYTAVDRAQEEAELAFAVNARAPEIMARWAAGRIVPIVHFSTDYVFDGSGTRPWTELDQPRPLSVYGCSKLEGEKGVRRSGAPHLVLRTSWVYGAAGKNFLCNIAGLALARRELRVVADQIGAPTSAALVAAFAAELIEQHSANLAAGFAKADGLCHLATTGLTSWHGFASAIVDGLRCRGVPLACQSLLAIATTEYPAQAVRPLNSRLSLERLSTTYGLVPPHWHAALDTELDKYVQSHKSAASLNESCDGELG